MADSSSPGPSYSSSQRYFWAVTGDGRWMVIIWSKASPAGNQRRITACTWQKSTLKSCLYRCKEYSYYDLSVHKRSHLKQWFSFFLLIFSIKLNVQFFNQFLNFLLLKVHDGIKYLSKQYLKHFVNFRYLFCH